MKDVGQRIQLYLVHILDKSDGQISTSTAETVLVGVSVLHYFINHFINAYEIKQRICLIKRAISHLDDEAEWLPLVAGDVVIADLCLVPAARRAVLTNQCDLQ